MAKLTLAVDAATLARARLRAGQEGTSLSAVLKQRLDEYAGASEARSRALRELLDSSARSTMRLGDRRREREDVNVRRQAE